MRLLGEICANSKFHWYTSSRFGYIRRVTIVRLMFEKLTLLDHAIYVDLCYDMATLTSQPISSSYLEAICGSSEYR